MCLTTTCAFRGETRTHFACARTCLPVSATATRPPPALLDLCRLVARVAAERARRRELAQLVADHLLGDEDRHVLAPVVHRDRVPDHVLEHRRRARPGA